MGKPSLSQPLILSFLVCIWALPCFAAPSASAIVNEFRKLDSGIKEEEQQLYFLKRQVSELEESQGEYQRGQKDLEVQARKLDLELDRTSKKYSEELKAYQPIEDKIESIKGVAQQRLVASYKFNPASVVETILSSQGSEIDMVRVSHYLSILREHDQKIISEFSSVLEERSKKKAELEILKQKNEDLKQKLEDQKLQLEDQAAWGKELIQKLNAQKKKHDATLVLLKSKYSKLQNYLDRLTAVNPAAGRLRQQLNQQASKGASSTLGMQDFQGPGLAGFIGTLPWPVEGQISRGFGKYKEQNLSDMLFSKGIEFKTSGEMAVSAVAPGQVIFAGQMPGYGLMVIVDHGQRYYSVYGRFSSLFVSSGQVLKKKDKIGVCNSGRDTGANLYFEIRKNGAAVDPKPYLGEVLPQVN